MAVLAVHPQRQGLHLPLVPPDRTQRLIYPRMSAKEMTGLEKTCQHRAMKHPKQSKRAPPHPSALVPSYHRILVKHGLIEKTLSIPDAYEVFLKVGADPEVQKLRRKAAPGNKMKHVPALYLATAMALQGITKPLVLPGGLSENPKRPAGFRCIEMAACLELQQASPITIRARTR